MLQRHNANPSLAKDDVPIGILPVPVGSDSANSLIVHGTTRCRLGHTLYTRPDSPLSRAHERARITQPTPHA